MKKNRVAILGMSFRLPGSNPGNFWTDLLAGKNLVSQVAADRWAQDAYWHPRKSHAGTSYTFAAGSIGDVSAFDAEFFGVSPREAAQIDPQQRLLLEHAWECVENAGVRSSDLRGTLCGVFVGISTIDYSFRFADDLCAIDSSVATGTSSSIAANRISYALDLRGPSLAIDTACSSSLVAFHLACRSIASGEIPCAIAGGVSVHTHPYGFVTFSKASMLSKRGVCSVFDASGDGYVRSEGCGVFFLKDYDRAIADGDPILAVVSASNVNSDGKKSGLTVPSVQGQSSLLTQAYAEAGISPCDVDYIEAHGTGTAVGDPIEAHALGEALGMHRPVDRPLLIGSVKSNIGHLEAAAGIAGLVKALHCIQYRTVPASIHFNNPNPNIRFGEWNLKVVTETTPLKPTGRIVVGINSFGFGGANAHVILESPEPHSRSAGKEPTEGPVPVVVTGRNRSALKAAAQNLARFIRERSDAPLYDVAWNTVFRREWHEHRAVFIADTRDALLLVLEQFADDATVPPVVESGVALPDAPECAFIYAGNGSQWEGMGRRLVSEEPVFRQSIQAIDEIFQPLAGFSLLDEIIGKNGTGRYERTEVAQPALFALQVGVTRVLLNRGIAPAAVAGHSVGEVAAAWASGALSLEQAVRVIYHRSRLQGTTRGRGGMTAVAIGEAAARELLEVAGLSAMLSIAGINSPTSATVAGAVPALEAFEASMTQRGVLHRRLNLDYAFHSPEMDPIERGVLDALSALRPSEEHLPFYSSVSGTPLEGIALDAGYWWRNIREPVKFQDAINSIQATGSKVYIEIGPHALLRSYISGTLGGENIRNRVLPTLMRNDDGPDRIASAIGQAVIAGAPMDWSTWFPRAGEFIQLPSYPWQRERHWHAVSPESYQRLSRRKEHPLLGYRLHESDWAWENQIDAQLCPTMADHVIGESIVMPGTAYVEMSLAAAKLWQGGDYAQIEQLEILTPLLLNDTQTKLSRFRIEPSDGSFTIQSRDQGSDRDWVVHAVGRILKEPQDALQRRTPLTLPVRTVDFTGEDHNALTRAVGLGYGPAFLAIDGIWVQNGSAYARFRVPDAVASELGQFYLHPALLDCGFQMIIQLLKDDYVVERGGMIYVPAKIDGLHCRLGGVVPHMARATLRRYGPQSITASFTLYDAAGESIAWIREARFNSMRLRKNSADRLRYLDYHGVPKPHALSPATAPRGLFDILNRKLAGLARSAAELGMLKRYSTEIEPLLDGLCGSFARVALQTLAADGKSFMLEDVRACAGANPEAAPLLARLIDMVNEDKAVAVTEANGHGQPAPEDIWNSLVADYPDFLPVFHGVGRVGMHLVDLVRGHRTLDEILPRECTPNRLSGVVLADSVLPAMEHAISDVVAHLVATLPAGKRLRIVEIGAAEPTFAAGLCRTLDFDRCDFVFATTATSIPEGYAGLQEKYPGVPIRPIGEGLLDAIDPAANEQFQIALIAVDIATDREITVALDYAKRHLCAGGAVLALREHPSRWMDFVFGGKRSWWKDASGGSWVSRHNSPTHWRSQMQRLGFQHATVLDMAAEGASGPFLVISQMLEHAGVATPRPQPSAPRTWLLLTDKENFSARFSDQLTRTLKARGDRVVRAVPGSQYGAVDAEHYQVNPCESAHFEQLLSWLVAAHGRLDGVLHLHGLGAAAGDGSPLLLLDRQVDRCAAAAALLKACENSGTNTTCWLITSRAALSWQPESYGRSSSQRHTAADGMDAALWGFGRSLMNEASGVAVRLVDIDDAAMLDTTAYSLVREISHPDAEQEIVLTGSGDRYAPRLRLEPAPAAQAESAAPTDAPTLRLGLQYQGQLRNLRWEAHARALPGHDEIEIEVRATGLNFRDVMYALGLLSDEAVEGGFAGPTLGLEFSGVVTSVGDQVQGIAPGDRVMGFGPMGFASRVVTRASSVSPIPAGMSFEAAATVPSAFFTVHYALNYLARLEEGEKILIHGAAGGVGIAAIQIARSCGAEIYATAGTDEKRDFLRLMGVDHVFDSRSLAFADEILAITEGRGVDVVLNSLAGEAINRNLRVLKPFGRFLELGKRDFQENTRIGLRPFRNNISYFGIDADQLMKERPDLTENLFREVVQLFDEGFLHPLPFRCFEAEEVVDAFRHMQQSRHIGKIVVTYRKPIRAVHGISADARRIELLEDAAYLVTGGLRGFGLKTAERLAARGARNLVLVGRGGPSAEAIPVISALERAGVKVHVAACDVTDHKALASLLSEIAVIMPPLRGIVHAATVIEDGLARNLNRGQIRRVFAPKILGAHHLHQLTLGKALDFFVLFSSATTLFGNPGQGSYVAANAAMEALAASRRAAGLPALCVRWGGIEDAGYLARNAQFKEALEGRMGGSMLQSDAALDVLEELMVADRSGMGVLEFDWKALSRFLPVAGSPKFGELSFGADEIKADDDGGEDLRRMIARMSAEELTATFVEIVKQEVGEILRIAPDKIDESRPLYDMGFDSLMGVELTTAVESRFSVKLPAMALSESPTVARLSAKILSQLTGTQSAEDSDAAADQARQLASRHADESHAASIVRTAAELESGELDTVARMIQ